MKKRLFLLLGIGLLISFIGFILLFQKSHGSRKMTFEECENAGGKAWLVDLYQPDICPSCVEYQACKDETGVRSNDSEECPQAKQCAECIDKNFPYPDQCPNRKEKIGEISDAAIWFQCCK